MRLIKKPAPPYAPSPVQIPEGTKPNPAANDPMMFYGPDARVRVDKVEPVTPRKSDSDANKLAWLLELEDDEHTKQENWRIEQLLDHQYYDNIQYTHEELAELAARGQPAVTYNWLASRIDWLTGTERRARIQGSVIPRDENPERQQDAETKTKYLKHLADSSGEPFLVSHIFKEAAIGGLSWIETGIRHDPEDHPVYKKKESWWNVLQDSADMTYDGSEFRYLFRGMDVDSDVACASWPEHKDRLMRDAHAENNRESNRYYLGRQLSDYDLDSFRPINQRERHLAWDGRAWRQNPRSRIYLRECWYFEPTRETGRTRGGGVYDRIKLRSRLAIFADGVLVSDDYSAYRHNKMPFTPLYCFRRAVDGAPYGLLRRGRDPQDSFNKRMGKALFATNSARLLYELGAIDAEVMSVEQMRTEIAKPTAMMAFAHGAISGGKAKIERGYQDAEAAMQIAKIDMAFLEQGMGVNADNLGLETNATSGVAISKRQAIGNAATGEIFDNRTMMLLSDGKKTLSLIEQFLREPLTVALRGSAGQVNYLHVNRPNPDGSVANDITRFEADWVLDLEQYHATLNASAMDEFGRLLERIASVDPQMVRELLDMYVQYSPMPGKDVIVARIRAKTGQTDPRTPPTPEEEQVKQQAMAQAEALGQREAEARLSLLEAQAAQMFARVTEAEKRGQAMEASQLREILQAFKAAMEAAAVSATAPGLAPVADSMLASAGFVDKGGQDPDIPAPPQQPPPPGV